MPVARVVRDQQVALIQHPDKSGFSTAMLDAGPAGELLSLLWARKLDAVFGDTKTILF